MKRSRRSRSILAESGAIRDNGPESLFPALTGMRAGEQKLSF
jgi:hypothetical protein